MSDKTPTIVVDNSVDLQGMISAAPFKKVSSLLGNFSLVSFQGSSPITVEELEEELNKAGYRLASIDDVVQELTQDSKPPADEWNGHRFLCVRK